MLILSSHSYPRISFRINNLTLDLCFLNWYLTLTVPSEVSWICLLLQQCLDGRGPETPLLPASDHPPTSFQWPPLASKHSQHRLLSSSSLLPSNHELPSSAELFYPGGGCRRPPGHLHLRASYSYVSLDLYFHRDMWPWRDWATSPVSWQRRS